MGPVRRKNDKNNSRIFLLNDNNFFYLVFLPLLWLFFWGRNIYNMENVCPYSQAICEKSRRICGRIEDDAGIFNGLYN